MKKIFSILISIFIFIFISCNKDKVLLNSELHLDSLMDEYYNFKIKKDSTFQFFTKKVMFDGSIEKDSTTGIISFKNDTIYLKSKALNDKVEFDKAILKNGFIEFIHNSGCCVQKYKVLTSQFPQKETIDLSNFSNYAVLPYLTNNQGEKAYDLTQKNIEEIDVLLRNEIDSNSKFRKVEDYLIQLKSYTNLKREIIVVCQLICKNVTNEERFRYNEILMKDGGNCNVHIIIDLNKNEIKEINIAGEA